MAMHSKPAAKVQAQVKPMQAMKTMEAMKAMKAMKGQKAMKGNEATKATKGPWPIGPTLALHCMTCQKSWVWLWKTYHRVRCQCGAKWEDSIPTGHQRLVPQARKREPRPRPKAPPRPRTR